MTDEAIAAAVARLETIAVEVGTLRRSIDGEELAVNDRQYLSRCFDLLDMELGALREFLDGLA